MKARADAADHELDLMKCLEHVMRNFMGQKERQASSSDVADGSDCHGVEMGANTRSEVPENSYVGCPQCLFVAGRGRTR